jgi:hypothetical protein
MQALVRVHCVMHNTHARSSCYCLVWVFCYDSIEEAVAISPVHHGMWSVATAHGLHFIAGVGNSLSNG